MRHAGATGTVFASIVLAGGLSPSSAAGAAVPTPPGTGCPTAFQLLSLDALEAQGYVFAPDLDANQDRHICGKPLNPVVQEQVCEGFPGGICPVPVIYYVRDNDVAQT